MIRPNQYGIGKKYRYAGQKESFTLIRVKENGFVFYFKCGHWCTDLIFRDLIEIGTGIAVREQTQLKILWTKL